MPGVQAPVDFTEGVSRIAHRLDAIGNCECWRFGGFSAHQHRLILLMAPLWLLHGTGVAQSYRYLVRSELEPETVCAVIALLTTFSSLIFGSLADKFGRRTMLATALSISLVGLVLQVVMIDLDAWKMMTVITSIGSGCQLSIASTLLQELLPVNIQSSAVVLLQVFWSIGGIIGLFMSGPDERYLAWLARAIMSLFCMTALWFTPESPKWLASVGRYQEAVAIVEKIERAHGVEQFVDRASLGNVEVYHVKAPRLDSQFKRVMLLLRSPFLVRTGVLCTLWFSVSITCAAVFDHIEPAYFLLEYKYAEPLGRFGRLEWKLVILIAQLPGCLAAVYSVNRWDARVVLAAGLVGAIVASGAAALIVKQVWGLYPVLIACSLFAFFMAAAQGCLLAYGPENYPTAIRGVGTGLTSGFGHTSMSAVATLLVRWYPVPEDDPVVWGDDMWDLGYTDNIGVSEYSGQLSWVTGYSEHGYQDYWQVYQPGIGCGVFLLVAMLISTLVIYFFGLEIKSRNVEIYDKLGEDTKYTDQDYNILKSPGVDA